MTVAYSRSVEYTTIQKQALSRLAPPDDARPVPGSTGVPPKASGAQGNPPGTGSGPFLAGWEAATSRGYRCGGKLVKLSRHKNRRSYARIIRRLLAAIPVSEMTEEKVADWVAQQQARTTNPYTRNYDRKAVVSFGKYLFTFHGVSHNGGVHLGSTIPMEKEPVGQRAVFTRDQIEFLRSMDFPQMREPYRTLSRAFLNIAIDTGARPIEIARTRWTVTGDCETCFWHATETGHSCSLARPGKGWCRRYLPDEALLSFGEGRDLHLTTTPPKIRLHNAKAKPDSPHGVFRGRGGLIIRMPERIVPLTATTRAALLTAFTIAHRFDWWRGCEFLFCTRSNQAWATERRPTEIARQIRIRLVQLWPELAETPLWLGLRHTAITQLLASGAPLHLVAKSVGHTSVTTTMSYAPVEDPEGIAAFERAWTSRWEGGVA